MAPEVPPKDAPLLDISDPKVAAQADAAPRREVAWAVMVAAPAAEGAKRWWTGRAGYGLSAGALAVAGFALFGGHAEAPVQAAQTLPKRAAHPWSRTTDALPNMSPMPLEDSSLSTSGGPISPREQLARIDPFARTETRLGVAQVRPQPELAPAPQHAAFERVAGRGQADRSQAGYFANAQGPAGPAPIRQAPAPGAQAPGQAGGAPGQDAQGRTTNWSEPTIDRQVQAYGAPEIDRPALSNVDAIGDDRPLQRAAPAAATLLGAAPAQARPNPPAGGPAPPRVRPPGPALEPETPAPQDPGPSDPTVVKPGGEIDPCAILLAAVGGTDCERVPASLDAAIRDCATKALSTCWFKSSEPEVERVFIQTGSGDGPGARIGEIATTVDENMRDIPNSYAYLPPWGQVNAWYNECTENQAGRSYPNKRWYLSGGGGDYIIHIDACSHSPLVLDLDGQGRWIGTTEIVYDLVGKGRAMKIHDIAPGSGILVFDADRRGHGETAGYSGLGLFGNNTDLDGDRKADGYRDGFEAFEAFVRKAEQQHVVPPGTLDSRKLGPAELASLEKAYGFGIRVGSMRSPVRSLKAAGVKEIQIASGEGRFTDVGEDQIEEMDGAMFTRLNGTVGMYVDVWLRMEEPSERYLQHAFKVQRSFQRTLAAKLARPKQ